MQHSLFLPLTLIRKIKPLWPTIMLVTLILFGCNLANREYSVEAQYELARNRAGHMKQRLSFRVALEKERIYMGQAVLFTAHFTNNTETSLTLRIPQPSGVLDIEHPSTTIKYSIAPLDKSISLMTPLSFSGMPYVLLENIRPSEFVSIDPYATKEVKLELPNTVYVKQGELWVESVLPPGEYLIDMRYENLYIGYEVEKTDEIQVVDLSAWVGQVDAETVSLTVLP
jgi:hypothetical protein